MKTEPTVAVGQLWANNDPRSSGRILRIVEIGKAEAAGFVFAEVVQSARSCRRLVPGRRVRIAIARLKPTRNGYRLLDADEADGS